MKKRPSKRARAPALAVAETWFVKLPGALQLACVDIEAAHRSYQGRARA